MHGAESAMRFVPRMPPRCIAGRWQSLSKTQSFLAAPGSGLVVPVLTAALGGSPAVPASAVSGAADADAGADCGLDELRVEAHQAYRRKMGRWASETVAGVCDQLFWQLLRIAQ
eukprot:15417216-Alexandrium_andersonii.AAC.1